MTYQEGQPAAFPYPPEPWFDGQTAYQDNDDGTRTVATYEQQNNTWHVEKIRNDIGDYYITTQDVYIVGNQEVDGKVQNYETVAALLNDGGPTTVDSRALTTQFDVNQLDLDLMRRAVLDQRRTQDNVDFLQEAVADGLWIRKTGDSPASIPGPAEFFAFNSNGQPVYTFSEVERFLFFGRGTGVLNQNPTLAETKVGDYLLVQNNGDNEAGLYLVTELQVSGHGGPSGDQPDIGGSWYLQVEVSVVGNKAYGDVSDSDHCTVRVTRPIVLLPTPTQPIVPAEGYIWFKSDTHELFISTRGDTDPEEPDVPQWVKIGPGAGGGVTGDYLPLSGGTITGDLAVNGTVKTLNVDSGQSSNLNLKCNGATKIYVGQNETTFQGPIKLNTEGTLDNHAITKGYVDNAVGNIDLDYLPLTGGALTGALSVENGDEVALTIKNGSSDQIKFWGSGAVALSSGYTDFKDNELVTKAYVDGTVGNIDLDYLPLTGGTLNGQLTVRKNSEVALEIIGDNNASQIKFWSSGAIALESYTNFQNNELVTKKYVDDAIANIDFPDPGGPSFTPGDKVASGSASSTVQGGFYIQNGSLYCKIT